MSRRGLGYISSSGTGTVVSAGVLHGVATGGASSSITVSSVNYTLLTYLSDANLVVTSPGLFDVLLVGGGGGGGGGGESGQTNGGGGGAGQIVGINDLISIYLAAGTYAVDVGAGGSAGSSGFGSAIGTVISAAGGGRGASQGFGPRQGYQTAGGSGGGHVDASSFVIGDFGGNLGAGNSSSTVGGGGGGAGGAGSTSTGGAGIEINTWIGGSSYLVAGGGAGNGGTGGSGGGGAVNGNGTDNKGAGGGGLNGLGGSGVVYVRFKI